MAWHQIVILKLRASGLFQEVRMVGAKVRASISATSFVDIHFDPTTSSYSYALIDLTSLFPGDKRVFGWDDYAHEGAAALENCRRFRTIFSGAMRLVAGYLNPLPCGAR